MYWKVKKSDFFRARSAPLTYVIFIVKYGDVKSKVVRMRAIRSLTIFLSRTNSPIRSPNRPPRPPSTDSQQKTVQYACAERSPRPLSVDNEPLYRTSQRWTTGTVEAPTSLWDPLLWIARKKLCNMRALRGLNDPLSVDNEAIYILYSFQTLDDSSYHYQASTHPPPWLW